VEKHLFVVAEPMKEIKDLKAVGSIFVIAGREKHTVGDTSREGLARESVAFDAAGRGKGGREMDEMEERKEEEKDRGHSGERQMASSER
jgi:hypothetical protein